MSTLEGGYRGTKWRKQGEVDVKNSEESGKSRLKHAARTLSASAMAFAPSAPIRLYPRLMFVTDLLTCSERQQKPEMSTLEDGYRGRQMTAANI